MRIVTVIQARTGSTRLPGKVLLELCGEPILVRHYGRTSRARTVDDVVIATTTEPADDGIGELCAARGYACFRGSETDVLDRHYRTACQFGAEAVVRVTSDCPLIDPEIVDQAVKAFLDGQPHLEYVSNAIPKDTFPRGLDVEVIRFDALARAWREDRNPAWREHVTPYIYRHAELFNLGGIQCETDYSSLRWTVDTPEDFAFVTKIYESFGHDRFGLSGLPAR